MKKRIRFLAVAIFAITCIIRVSLTNVYASYQTPETFIEKDVDDEPASEEYDDKFQFAFKNEEGLIISPVYTYSTQTDTNDSEPYNQVRTYNHVDGINKGIDINAQDIYGMTPLHYALRSKNAEAAIALLKAGANPNLPNQDGLIPLSMIGYIPERLDVLELMLQKGANVHYLVNEDETILESYKPTANEPQLKPIYELMKKYS